VLNDARLKSLDDDYAWLEFLHRFGDQSSASLRMLTEQTRTNRGRALNRMAQLRNCKFGDFNGPVFYYPEQQHSGAATKRDIDRRLICYSLQKKYGTQALKEARKFQRYAPTSAYKEWEHFFMDSWLSASVFFATRNGSYRFHVHDEIVERLNGVTEFEVSYSYKTLDGVEKFREKAIVRPDRFFSIEYPNGEERLFIQETDRGSERTDTDKLDVKSHRHSNYAYAALIGVGDTRRKYLPHWSKFAVLNAFTDQNKMQGAMQSLLDISGGKGSPYMLFRCFPAFGKYFDPIPPDRAVFTDPWSRAGHEPFFINRS
jgi:hypothetical protein